MEILTEAIRSSTSIHRIAKRMYFKLNLIDGAIGGSVTNGTVMKAKLDYFPLILTDDVFIELLGLPIRGMLCGYKNGSSFCLPPMFT